jgi:hypothetical protein
MEYETTTAEMPLFTAAPSTPKHLFMAVTWELCKKLTTSVTETVSYISTATST